MQIFFIFLVAAILIALLIGILHILQVRSAKKAAEQADPLPPLVDRIAINNPIGVVSEFQEKPSAPLPWQDEVKVLRDKGQYQEAIRLCRRQYPKMLAYRQTLITLRASLRQEDPDNDDALGNLYRTAILANLAKSHKYGPSGENFSAWADKLKNPREYWQTLGYKNLDLLTKNDCRLLTEHWGEPEYHSDIESVLANH